MKLTAGTLSLNFKIRLGWSPVRDTEEHQLAILADLAIDEVLKNCRQVCPLQVQVGEGKFRRET